MAKTFEEIAEKVRILNQLELLCDAVASANWERSRQIWYEIIKPVVVKNVGFDNGSDEFNSTEDYETVYEHLSKRIGL